MWGQCTKTIKNRRRRTVYDKNSRYNKKVTQQMSRHNNLKFISAILYYLLIAKEFKKLVAFCIIITNSTNCATIQRSYSICENDRPTKRLQKLSATVSSTSTMEQLQSTRFLSKKPETTVY